MYSGPDDSANLLGIFCGDVDSIVVLTSDMKTLFVRFYSDDSISSPGFNATFKEFHSDTGNYCGGTFSGPSGYIYTPFYPDNYDFEITCDWYISVSANFLVAIAFLDFHLEWDVLGCPDAVEVN